MDAPKAIEVVNIVKRYGNFTAVDGVSFDVAEGEIFGLLGPNGAGKSTLIRMLTTLLEITGGTALIDGYDVHKNPDKARLRIGVIPQAMTSDGDLTVWENLSIYSKLYGIATAERERSIDELLELVDLTQWRDAPAKNLSGGMRRRLEIARGLVHRPNIFFLDEPTTGLDPQARRNFWELVQSIKARRKTIILTTHYMEEAELLCDEIAIMDRGRIIAQGPPRRLLHEHFAEVLLELPRQEFPPAARELPLNIIDASDRVEISTHDLEATLRTLLEARVPLGHLRIRPGNLEDLFLELTGKELRP